MAVRSSNPRKSERQGESLTPAHETILRRRAQQRRDRAAASLFKDVVPTDFERIPVHHRKKLKHHGRA